MLPFSTDIKEGWADKVKQKLAIGFHTAVQRYQQNRHKVNVGKNPYHVIKRRLNFYVWSVQARLKQTAKYLSVLSLMTSPTGSSTLIPCIQIKKHGKGDVNTYYCSQEWCYLMHAVVLPHMNPVQCYFKQRCQVQLQSQTGQNPHCYWTGTDDLRRPLLPCDIVEPGTHINQIE